MVLYDSVVVLKCEAAPVNGVLKIVLNTLMHQILPYNLFLGACLVFVKLLKLFFDQEITVAEGAAVLVEKASDSVVLSIQISKGGNSLSEEDAGVPRHDSGCFWNLFNLFNTRPSFFWTLLGYREDLVSCESF
jgi:hypothetical protein